MKFKQFPVIELAMQYAQKINNTEVYVEVHEAFEENSGGNFAIEEMIEAKSPEEIPGLPLPMVNLHDAALDIWEAAHRDVCTKRRVSMDLHEDYAVFFPVATQARIEEAALRLVNYRSTTDISRIDYTDYLGSSELSSMAQEMASAFNYMLASRFSKDSTKSDFNGSIKANAGELIIDSDTLAIIQNIARQK